MKGQELPPAPVRLPARTRDSGDELFPWRRSRWLELAALALVVGVGAYLRLAALDYGQFRLDDVALWNIARHVADQPQLLTRGIPASVAGFANGPFQAYLLLPAALLSANPLGAYLVVALFNVLGIGLFWAFSRRYWGSRLALLAALLFAVNPWAVVFSRRVWGNDLVAPLTVLLIWSLCDLARHGRRRDSVLPFLWLAIVIQVYVGALTHLVLAGLGLGFGARKLRTRYLVGGVALFGVLTAPYLLGALAPNVGEIAFTLGTVAAPAQVDLASTYYLFHSVSAEGYQAFANNAGAIVDASGGLPRVVSWLTGAFLAIGLGVGLAEVARCARRRTFEGAVPILLVLTAVLLPALLLVRHSAPVFVYYVLTGFPMHFLLVALGVRKTATVLAAAAPVRYLPRDLVRRLAAGAAVGLIVGTHLFLFQAFLLAIREYWPKSDYGMPLRYTLDLAEAVRNWARQEGSGRVYLGGLENREGVLFRALRPELENLSFLNLADTFVVPNGTPGKVLFVLPTSDERIGAAFAEHFADAAVASLRVPGHGLRYAIYALSNRELGRLGELAEIRPARRDSARLGDYLDLIGYDLPAESPAGGHLRVTMYWKLLARPPEDINLYAHLIGGLGSLWGQQDGLGYPIVQWQPGDLLVQSHDVPVPAGAPPVDYQVEAGGYFRTTGERLPVQRNTGADDRLRLGTVKVLRPPPSLPLSLATPVEARFGDAIRLLGYELSPRSPAAGDHLRLTLYWQSVAPTTADYTVFNHLTGVDSRPLAQADGPPAFGAYPTSAWQSGDVVRDVHELVIPADIPAGRYRLLTGLYVPPSGPRLAPIAPSRSIAERLGAWVERNSAYQSGPRVDGDHVVLAVVEVQSKR